MLLDGFQENSFTHWSGRISSVIHFSKTNFLPPYLRDERSTLQIKPTPWQKIRLSLEKNKNWVDGVVLTGGEPTLYPHLSLLCKKIKLAGFPIKIDTNGTNPDILMDLIRKGLVDYVSIDVYAPLEFPKYSRATGLKDKHLFMSIRRSVSNIITSGFPHEIRTVVAHEFHKTDDIRDIVSQARLAQKYVIQNTANEYTMSERELNTFAFAAKEVIRNTEIRKTRFL